MKSFTPDAPPDGGAADQVAGDVPTAENAGRAALTRIARLARFTAEIVVEILVRCPG